MSAAAKRGRGKRRRGRREAPRKGDLIFVCLEVDRLLKAALQRHNLDSDVSCIALDILKNSRQANTLKAYRNKLHIWMIFCYTQNISPFDTSVQNLLCFLSSLLYKPNISRSTFESTFFALNWFFSLFTANRNPCDNAIIRSVLEAARRKLASAHCRKSIFYKSDVERIFSFLYKYDSSCLELRLVGMIVMAFYGFLRISEILSATIGDVCFEKKCVSIVIPKAKNDVYREGQIVRIASLPKKLCPVTMLKCYVDCVVVRSKLRPDDPFFPQLRATKVGHRPISQPISYSLASRELKQVLGTLGMDPKKYGWHSFRSGGCTAAFEGGVDLEKVKRHGRWKSDLAMARYVMPSMDSMLEVTRLL